MIICVQTIPEQVLMVMYKELEIICLTTIRQDLLLLIYILVRILGIH